MQTVAVMESGSEEFKFPDIYNFPPFYTKQINEATFQSQLLQWKKIITGYCKHFKIFVIDVDNNITNGDKSQKKFIFENDAINRKASDELVADILKYLVDEKVGEWIENKSSVYVYWRSLNEWSEVLYDLIDNRGELGKVFTLFELIKDNEEFSNMSQDLFIKIVTILSGQSKAVVLDDEDGKIVGVKFI